MPSVEKSHLYFGFIFSFYSLEHEPIHVHVKHGSRESIIELIIINKELVDLRVIDHGNPLTSIEEKTARLFVEK